MARVCLIEGLTKAAVGFCILPTKLTAFGQDPGCKKARAGTRFAAEKYKAIVVHIHITGLSIASNKGGCTVPWTLPNSFHAQFLWSAQFCPKSSGLSLLLAQTPHLQISLAHPAVRMHQAPLHLTDHQLLIRHWDPLHAPYHQRVICHWGLCSACLSFCPLRRRML